MTLGTEFCNVQLVSEMGRQLAAADHAPALIAFTREILSCRRLRECAYGDYCTIFSASLLAERAKQDGGPVAG